MKNTVKILLVFVALGAMLFTLNIDKKEIVITKSAAFEDPDETKYPKMSNGSVFCCKNEQTDGCDLAGCD